MKKALTHLKSADPILARIIERVGPYRIAYTDPTFHGLAKAIVYQQLSGSAAGTIFNRFLAAAGNPLQPEAILALTVAEMRSIGLSGQKTTYLRDLAEKTAGAQLRFDKLPRLTNDQVILQLTQVKGIGLWTAHMFLMFALRRPDVLPTGDLGIRNAVMRAYSLPELPLAAQIEEIARCWRPYCSVASWYLWRSLELSADGKETR